MVINSTFSHDMNLIAVEEWIFAVSLTNLTAFHSSVGLFGHDN